MLANFSLAFTSSSSQGRKGDERRYISAFSPPPEKMQDCSQPSVLSLALNWEILLPKEANQDQARQDEGQPTQWTES